MKFKSHPAPIGSAILLFASLIFSSLPILAQDDWVPATGKIYYTGGNVGIGTTSPTHNLHIQGTGGEGVMRLSNDNTSYLSSQNVITGVIANSARQWNSNYSATNIEETSAIKFGYYAHVYGQVYNAAIRFYTQENGSGATTERMSIVGDKVGIGTTTPQSKLEVNGTSRFNAQMEVDGNIIAEEVKIQDVPNPPDFVFEDDYNLLSLNEVEDFINENGHLPDIPSASEMQENGVRIGELNMKLLQKIEELTLYVLEKEKQYQDVLERLERIESNENNTKSK